MSQKWKLRIERALGDSVANFLSCGGFAALIE